MFLAILLASWPQTDLASCRQQGCSRPFMFRPMVVFCALQLQNGMALAPPCWLPRGARLVRGGNVPAPLRVPAPQQWQLRPGVGMHVEGGGSHRGQAAEGWWEQGMELQGAPGAASAGMPANSGKDVDTPAKPGGLLQAVSRVRVMLGAGLATAFVGAMLALDFYWAAVKPQNFVFVIGMLALSWGLNKFRFDSNKAHALEPPPALLPQPWVRPYANFMAVISIVVPWTLILSGQNFYSRLFVMAPHLYLVMAQVVVEALGSRLRWAVPVRLLTPLAFNTYRLLSLRDWFVTVVATQTMSYETMFSFVDKILVTLNIVLWTFNLIVVLFAGIIRKQGGLCPECMQAAVC